MKADGGWSERDGKQDGCEGQWSEGRMVGVVRETCWSRWRKITSWLVIINLV